MKVVSNRVSLYNKNSWNAKNRKFLPWKRGFKPSGKWFQTECHFTELANLLGIKDDDRMMEVHHHWVEKILRNRSNKRDSQWAESIAVGDKEFVLETKERLGAKAVGRKISGKNGNYELREYPIP